MNRPVGFVTDLEGNGRRWEHYIARGSVLERTTAGELAVKEGHHFVFGGDTLDRGPQGLRILSDLVGLKKRQPEQVTLLLGNRDINKMRLRDSRDQIRELLLKLNSPRALEFRIQELQGTLDQALDSFLADIAPGGLLYDYWHLGELASVIDGTIYTHGQIRRESVGRVPGRDAIYEDVREWARELNAWARSEVLDWCARKGGHTLIAYQHPSPETPGRNDLSVIYGRLRDSSGNTELPPRALLEQLRSQGIFRAVSGHTPQGETPVVIRAPVTHDFELVIGDHSYSETDLSSDIVIQGDALRIDAHLPEGQRLTLETRIGEKSPIGRRTRDGYLVVGPLSTGEALLMRIGPGFKSERRVAPWSGLESLLR